jgi:mRNA-degrading endonuclease RelE of RelBE toxin-antitoxin system
MLKMVTIIAFSAFLAQIGVCLATDERDALLDFLARHPDTGDKIPGMGGLRKLCWRGKGKGKRGGLRVIYYFYNDAFPVFLLTVYGKGVQEDLTSQQKTYWRALVKMLKAECKDKRSLYGKAQYRQ